MRFTTFWGRGPSLQLRRRCPWPPLALIGRDTSSSRWFRARLRFTPVVGCFLQLAGLDPPISDTLLSVDAAGPL